MKLLSTFLLKVHQDHRDLPDHQVSLVKLEDLVLQVQPVQQVTAVLLDHQDHSANKDLLDHLGRLDHLVLVDFLDLLVCQALRDYLEDPGQWVNLVNDATQSFVKYYKKIEVLFTI